MERFELSQPPTSMSVQELEARIDEISADIEVQKQLIKQLVQQLERSRSAVQRQLNSLRDPVSRLPLEISSEIFLQCLPEHSRGRPRAHSAPMLLMSICNTWSDIALSTSALWSNIQLNSPQAKILRLWLQRARNHTCSVTLRRALDVAVANLLTEHSAQLKHLEIYDEDPVGSLALTAGGSFPDLETLTICSVMNRDGEWDTPNLSDVIQLLRLTPNLVECTLDTLYTYDDTSPRSTTMLVLPWLTCMNFGLNEHNLLSHDDILSHLSLPALQTLVVPFNYISHADFSLFLERSSPPLQKLVTGAALPFSELNQYLRLLPSLTHLDLFTTSQTFTDDFFPALADSSSQFVPELRDLKIQHTISDFVYETLLPALYARRTRLASFRATSWSCTSALGAGVSDTLGELAAGGMEIYIGGAQGDLFKSSPDL
ncbi:hypothetical protein B0H16DRAFT_1591149, partial [Mycena metata]